MKTAVWRPRLAQPHPIRRFIAVSALTALAIVVIGIVGFGVTTFRTDYAIVFLPMVIYCFLRIEAVGTREPYTVYRTSDPKAVRRTHWYYNNATLPSAVPCV